MKFEYDKEADAIYVYLSDKPYSYGKEIDNERIIDYSEDGEAIGVELLCVSHGVIVDDLPNRKEIENYLDKKGIKIFA